MSDSHEDKQVKDVDGNVLPQPATAEENAADTAAAAPKADELQKKREAVADAGLAHASMNNGQPNTKDEFSEAEREGDEADASADNVSEQTKEANKENDEAQGGSSEQPGQPAVGSDPMRDPGVDGDTEISDLPVGDPKPADTVDGSGDGDKSKEEITENN